MFTEQAAKAPGVRGGSGCPRADLEKPAGIRSRDDAGCALRLGHHPRMAIFLPTFQLSQNFFTILHNLFSAVLYLFGLLLLVVKNSKLLSFVECKVISFLPK